MRLTIGFVESPLRLKIVGGIDARIERRQKSARINGNQGGHGAVIARLEKIATDSEHGWQLVRRDAKRRSEEHTSELQSLMRSSYDVFCLKKKTHIQITRD